MDVVRFDEYPYGSVAPFYDELATLYSRGKIGVSKWDQLKAIERGDRVFYAGVGRGRDALMAARFGARVTAADLAPNMIGRLTRQFERENLEAELICGDVAHHRTDELYDVVVANYFLNLFEVERARVMLRHLGDLVRPGGALLLADFALPRGGPVARAITALYYRPVNWLAWAVGLCALHPILDYTRLLAPMNFRIHSERRLPVLLGANPAYVTIVAHRMI